MAALSEFSLIDRFFRRPAGGDVVLGVGDDAALLQPPPGEWLAVTSDTLIAGRHFPVETDPAAIGHKALAVNLSDLAAMGATPRWFLLALSLPEAEEEWLAAFASGLLALADVHDIRLVGGDTTRGPLSITITAMGTVPHGQALTRAGARPGDGIYVSGTVGDAGLGLQVALGEAVSVSVDIAQHARLRLDRPEPRVALGLALRGRATACLDVSDGLAQDLGHLLRASGVGATLALEQLPLSKALRALPPDQARRFALTAGDDYELCFTLPLDIDPAALALPVAVTRIGVITATPGLHTTLHGAPEALPCSGYNHFPDPS